MTYSNFTRNAYNSPFLVGAIVSGEHQHLDPIEIVTSESLVTVQLQDPLINITRLQFNGSALIRDQETNTTLEMLNLGLTSARSNPSNAVTVLVRGTPGSYSLNAVANTDDGSTLSKPFELILGAPFNTPPGTDIEQPVVGNDGEDLGAISFGDVTTGGETTVSLSSSGPDAPANFRVLVPKGNSGQGDLAYYDIRTTAEFDVATVCLNYDDDGFNGQQELQLQLNHYVCAEPATNTDCEWVNITAMGYPEILNNEICGNTDSFSIFAIVQPLDQDNDEVVDSLDNCPVTYNPEQEDLDTDGIGDACDSDVDGDGYTDDEDHCPFIASQNNNDLDGDEIGDICDSDIDGDTIDNVADNCPVNANSSQGDFDQDGTGNACDLDDDGDGVEDGIDDCQGSTPDAIIDYNGCSSPQRFELSCPSDGDYKNHGKYVSCVAEEANLQALSGLIDETDKGVAISTAAQSDIGKR